jgi:hypothetical protein
MTTIAMPRSDTEIQKSAPGVSCVENQIAVVS